HASVSVSSAACAVIDRAATIAARATVHEHVRSIGGSGSRCRSGRLLCARTRTPASTLAAARFLQLGHNGAHLPLYADEGVCDLPQTNFSCIGRLRTVFSRLFECLADSVWMFGGSGHGRFPSFVEPRSWREDDTRA